jgi:plasmid stability protein
MVDRKYAVHVRDVPADVYDRLKARAKANGRSLHSELSRILAAAAYGRNAGELGRGDDALLIESACRALHALRDRVTPLT